MGDCDCTYDFRELAPFVAKFRAGAEFIMGSRFRGYIEPGSMPPLHRYLGTPVTTAILNVIFGSRFSDIHCGMRGISREALMRMDLRSQSWEYASEMVLKSVHMRLRTEEVPIRFLKDREGRLSHHKRSGWFSPWQAAWINLRAMFVYGANFFLFKPGLLLLLLGLVLTRAAGDGPDHARTDHLRAALHAAGRVVRRARPAVRLHGDPEPGVLRLFGPADRAAGSAAFPTRARCSPARRRSWSDWCSAPRWSSTTCGSDFHLPVASRIGHLGVFGLMLTLCGFITFTFVLLLHSTAVAVRRHGQGA